MKPIGTILAVSAGALLALSQGAPAQNCPNGDTVGCWSPLQDFSVTSPAVAGDPVDPGGAIESIHCILVYVGENKARILCWDHLNPWYYDSLHPEVSTPNGPDIVLMDPNDGYKVRMAFEDGVFLSDDMHRLFCSAHVYTGDSLGTILIWGGGDRIYTFCPGNEHTAYYRPSRNGLGAFITGPNEAWDSEHPTKRYYPTIVALADGRVLALDGWCGCASQQCPTGNEDCISPCDQRDYNGDANVPALLDPATNTFTPLDDATYNTETWPFDMGYYTFTRQLSDGKLLLAGSDYEFDPMGMDPTVALQVYKLSVSTSNWETLEHSNIWHKSGVLYNTDKIFAAGIVDTGASLGGAEIIDFADENPTWTQLTMPECQDRAGNFYSVSTPDGKVVLLGGSGTALGDCASTSGLRLNAVVWDPYTDAPDGTWSIMAAMATPRLYHSSALLLPTGEIFIGGGQCGCAPNPGADCCLDDPPCGGLGGCANQRTYQIFKPPYFFQGTRPAIDDSAGPNTIYYDESFTLTLTTEVAEDITHVRALRPGCATHSIDQNARSLDLNFLATSSTTLSVAAPADANIAPPGYYMIFVAEDGDGPAYSGALPSEAHWVLLMQQPTEQSITILAADPPPTNVWSTQAEHYRDVLQDKNGAGTRQGIGGTSTPVEQNVTYASIAVTFSEGINLDTSDITVSCSYTGNQSCPTVASVDNGSMPNLIHLSGPIPPGGCTTISFDFTDDVIQYEFLPGDVNQDGTTNTADLLALQTAINNLSANKAANIARYDIDRSAPSAGVGSGDLLRVVQLLNGVNTTQGWNGVTLTACDSNFAGAQANAAGGMTQELLPEEVPGVIAAIEAACQAESVDATWCQQMITELFGPQS